MITETADIRFECEKCGQHLVVEAAAAGLTADCPICNTVVTVPSPNRPTAAKTPPPASPFADPGAEEMREELIDASLLNGKLNGDLERARREIAGLQEQLRELAEEHERLNASATHAQRELKTFQAERQQLKSEAAGLRQRLAGAEESLAQRNRELQELRDEQALAAEQLEAARRDSAASAEALAKVRAQLVITEESVALAREENAALRAEVATTTAERDAARGEVTTLAGRLATTEGDLDSALGRLASTEAQLTVAREKSGRLQHEQVELQARLDDAGNRLLLASETARKLEETEGALQAARAHAATAADRIASLETEREKLQAEVEALRATLKESHTGREMIEFRDRLDATIAERDRLNEQVNGLEADLRKLTLTEETVRGERDEALRARDLARHEVEELRDSQAIKDNEVLRGIVARLNAEIAQRTADVVRLKRAQYGVKLAYAVFGIGFLAVIVFALIVLPKALGK